MAASICEQSFKDEVLKSPIPVLVNFWAPWCGPCRLIEPLVQQLKETAPKPLKVVRVNADENFWLAQTFKLTNIPTVLVFYQGKVVHRLERVQGREEVLNTLKAALEDIPTSTDGMRPPEPSRQPLQI